jgi:helix-turn-helix protein
MTNGYVRMAWVWEQPLDARDKIVLLALAQHSSRDREVCWPRIQTLADECGLSAQSVRRAITALERANLVAAFDVWGATGSTSNTYVLNVEGFKGYEWERVSRVRANDLRRGTVVPRAELVRNGHGRHRERDSGAGSNAEGAPSVG